MNEIEKFGTIEIELATNFFLGCHYFPVLNYLFLRCFYLTETRDYGNESMWRVSYGPNSGNGDVSWFNSTYQMCFG